MCVFLHWALPMECNTRPTKTFKLPSEFQNSKKFKTLTVYFPRNSHSTGQQYQHPQYLPSQAGFSNSNLCSLLSLASCTSYHSQNSDLVILKFLILGFYPAAAHEKMSTGQLPSEHPRCAFFSLGQNFQPSTHTICLLAHEGPLHWAQLHWALPVNLPMKPLLSR